MVWRAIPTSMAIALLAWWRGGVVPLVTVVSENRFG